MGFDGVLADEEAVGDLAVAEALSDEGEDFELSGGDAEGVELDLVEGEGGRRAGSEVEGMRTSRRTIFSRGLVSLMPSQMPKTTKMMATMAP